MGAPAGHAAWTSWAVELRIAIRRLLAHLPEQWAFVRSVIDRPNVEHLPAHWNWLPRSRRPRGTQGTIHGSSRPMSIMPLASLREAQHRNRTRLQRNDDLAPGEGPAAGGKATSEPLAAG